MDLIAQGIGAVLAFFFGIIGNIFAHDICASADSVCAKIIKAAAARLAAFDQDSTEQEWLADLQEQETVTEKYRHAVGCLLAAPKMRRCALNAPLVALAPGLIWKERRRDGKKVWEARWHATTKAIQEGWLVKSVKLETFETPIDITVEHKQLLIETTRQLQTEQNQWLYDPNYRMRLEAESSERKQQIQNLIALGHTREEAVDAVYLPKSEKTREPRR
jgi:hypothetical protein